MKKERNIIILLASINFTHIIDFVIIMPLGPQLMRKMLISPQQFGLIVSVYTISAAISGFLCSFFADKFDRKKIILLAYFVFLIGTLLCGLARTYEVLLVARIVAGLGGGILTSQVNAVIGDLIPYERRGKAMGMLGMAFSLASIIGVPLGLFLGNHWSWEFAFYFIVVIGIIIFPLIWLILPNIDTHLTDEKYNPFAILDSVLKDKSQQLGLCLMASVMMGSFMIIPFVSPYMVANVGFKETDLTYIYLVGGLATLFSSPYVGKMSDKIGKFKVLRFVILISIFPILVITNLAEVHLYTALIISSIFFIFISARHAPANAIISNLTPSHLRGSYMSLISSTQNLTAGVASLLTGFIVVKNTNGQLLYYNYAGFIAIFFAFVCVYVAYLLKQELIKSNHFSE
ncbi:MAG: MFS transporter [Bacteroidetes bacterium]|nr:MAG: MFS transporter [Bacteroidota bacterium]TAG94343.1 MAG: MFS transporter [Bacteroidota bacterium]